jgi:transcriptional regulator with XRE-family HTH domain
MLIGGEIVNRIREIMKRRGITQEELSKMTGISQGTLSKIINEKKEITLTTARKLSDSLGYGVDYIWPN